MPVVCFSHLRWNFVYQRPQHLLSRFAQSVEVHYWEEPVFEPIVLPQLRTFVSDGGINVLTPVLPEGQSDAENIVSQRDLLNTYVRDVVSEEFIAWYYTPLALRFSTELSPAAIVYDCMDELSAFQGAPPALVEEELRLFERADVVFTGGASLYKSKKNYHPNVHLFPSSIDFQHFAAARKATQDPADQASISRPRVGFHGVLDERLDRELLGKVADAYPNVHFVLIGPVVKIREDELPSAPNLHYLGQKDYKLLPSYLSNWDAAMIPFARNDSTRFISPTKTPEYLAAGKPVVSTSIQDVVDPYGVMALVDIADDADAFGHAIQRLLEQPREGWLAEVDTFLAGNSWDKTFQGMCRELQRCMPKVRRFRSELKQQGAKANV